MFKRFIAIATLVMIALLTACSTVSTPAQAPVIPWKNRETQVSEIRNWTLQSALSIRQPKQASIVSLLWVQQGRNYTQTISGPFSLGGVRIVGRPGQVTLWESATKQTTASDPEKLLLQTTGLQLPISNLYYWVRGLPVPGLPSKEKFDDAHRLVTLDQQGWHIQYLAFKDVNDMDLPAKIMLTRNDLQVKLVINRWVIQ